MKAELVSIDTDTQPLDGLYYAAEGRSRGAVLLMHGATMNFYVGALRFLPPVLARLGFACLAYNRRGHDILSTRDSRVPEGGAFSTIAEAIADNDYAAAWLGARGFSAPVVIGHSHGGMFAARHVAHHDETPALVLLSAHGGGPEQIRRASANGLFAREDYEATLARARAMIAEGRGGELMLLPGWYYAITATSLVDAVENMPALLESAANISCPVLFIRGDEEPPHIYPAEEFCRLAAGPARAEVVAGCDHFYTGRENIVAGLVAGWLDETLP